MSEFEDKLAAAEVIWARGPRSFGVGEIGVSVVNHAIRRAHNGLPVSRFLPLRAGGRVVTDGGRKIRLHADGMRTDLRGRPIVASRDDQRRVEAHYGVNRE